MHTTIKLSPSALNKNDVVDWLKNNFEIEFNNKSTPLAVYTNEVSAIFYEEYERFDDVNYNDNFNCGYEINIYDNLSKTNDFEKKWDWWIIEKWHVFNASFKDIEAMQVWCRSHIKMSNWKKQGSWFKFKNIEDFDAFSAVFGEEYSDAWSESMGLDNEV